MIRQNFFLSSLLFATIPASAFSSTTPSFTPTPGGSAPCTFFRSNMPDRVPLQQPQRAFVVSPRKINNKNNKEYEQQLFSTATAETFAPRKNLVESSSTFLTDATRSIRNFLKKKKQMRGMASPLVLAYIFLSNVSVAVATSTAWYTFSLRTGASPIAAGQEWKSFAILASSAIAISQSLFKPVVMCLSVGLGKPFWHLIEYTKKRFNMGHKAATGTVCFISTLLGTSLTLCLGILSASLASGVAIFG